jgi:hypothetical protein
MSILNKYDQYLIAFHLRNLLVMLNNFLTSIYKYFSNKKDVPAKETILDATDKYIEVRKKIFLESYNKSNNFNSNIDNIFYSKKDYQAEVITYDNNLEKKWKTKYLLESTPRGNIFMYYDSYKLGFAYYSDIQSLTYNLLNAVAMKYCLLFQCRDFFMDELITTPERISPLVKLHLIEEKKEKTDNIMSIPDLRAEDSPFIKLKHYNTATSKMKKEEKVDNEKNKKVELKEYSRNKFVSLGKMTNLKLLQKVPKKNHVNHFNSSLLDGLIKQTEVQEEVFNYKKYKELKQKQA